MNTTPQHHLCINALVIACGLAGLTYLLDAPSTAQDARRHDDQRIRSTGAADAQTPSAALSRSGAKRHNQSPARRTARPTGGIVASEDGNRSGPSLAERAHDRAALPPSGRNHGIRAKLNQPLQPAEGRRVAMAANDYQLDDGEGENGIGTGDNGTIITWYTWYTIIAGKENLSSVNVEAGFAAGDCSGLPVTVAVLDDPDGDGDPADAEIIETGTGTLGPGGDNVTTKVSLTRIVTLPLEVTNPQGRFFIAAQVTQNVAAGCDFPATVDQTGGTNPGEHPNRNYIGIGALADCPNQGGGGGAGCIVDCASENCGIGTGGDWLLRANAITSPCDDGFCTPGEFCTCQVGNPNCGGSGEPPCDCPLPDPSEGAPSPGGDAACTDNIDNDCDGDTDCADTGCAANNNCIDCIVDCGRPAEGGGALGACPGGVNTVEPVCFDGAPPDNFNGGCNSNHGFVYSCELETDGPAVCATSGRYFESCLAAADCPAGDTCSGGLCRTQCPGGDSDCNPNATPAPETCEPDGRCSGEWTAVRDTDWYLVEIPPGPSNELEACVTASFGVVVGFVDDAGGPNCAAAAFIDSAIGQQCTFNLPETVCVETCLAPGLHTVFVAPSSTDLTVACGSGYTVELNGSACGAPPSCGQLIDQGDLACQIPNQQGHGLPPDDGLVAMTSTAPLTAADTFAALAPGGIDQTCWWGTYVEFVGLPGPCTEADWPADDFTITYYTNGPDILPGAVLAQFPSVTSVRVATGLLIGSGAGPLIEVSYSATHDLVDISDTSCNWLEIVNALEQAEPCVWVWETAGGGDNTAAQDGAGDGYQPGVSIAGGDHVLTDLAWCVGRTVGSPELLVSPGGCNLTGGCCHDAAGSCTNDQDFASCLSSGGRFGLDQDCPLEPACPCSDFADCGDVDGDHKRDDPCLWYACDDGTCSSLARGTGNGGQYGQADIGGAFGVCPPDGIADAHDKFHALNSFANVNQGGLPPYPCEPWPLSAINIDAGSSANCALDGVCDGNDAFHALNSFANSFFGQPGGYQCTCPPPGPAPTQPIEPDEYTGLLLRAPEFVRPGDLVDVDVYLTTGVKSLTGYQLHLGISGGVSGHLELVDISIREPSVLSEQRDRQLASVRAGLKPAPTAHSTWNSELETRNSKLETLLVPAATWSAFNISSHQMLAGIDALQGVTAPAGAYLATFTYHVPPEAAGTFVVDVLYDPSGDSLEERTFVFGHYGRPVGLSPVVPVRISVRAAR